jgi:hypothetical protein
MKYGRDNLSVPHKDGGYSIKGYSGGFTGFRIFMGTGVSEPEGRVATIVDGCDEGK